MDNTCIITCACRPEANAFCAHGISESLRLGLAVIFVEPSGGIGAPIQLESWAHGPSPGPECERVPADSICPCWCPFLEVGVKGNQEEHYLGGSPKKDSHVEAYNR